MMIHRKSRNRLLAVVIIASLIGTVIALKLPGYLQSKKREAARWALIGASDCMFRSAASGDIGRMKAQFEKCSDTSVTHEPKAKVTAHWISSRGISLRSSVDNKAPECVRNVGIINEAHGFATSRYDHRSHQPSDFPWCDGDTNKRFTTSWIDWIELTSNERVRWLHTRLRKSSETGLPSLSDIEIDLSNEAESVQLIVRADLPSRWSVTLTHPIAPAASCIAWHGSVPPEYKRTRGGRNSAEDEVVCDRYPDKSATHEFLDRKRPRRIELFVK